MEKAIQPMNEREMVDATFKCFSNVKTPIFTPLFSLKNISVTEDSFILIEVYMKDQNDRGSDFAKIGNIVIGNSSMGLCLNGCETSDAYECIIEESFATSLLALTSDIRLAKVYIRAILLNILYSMNVVAVKTSILSSYNLSDLYSAERDYSLEEEILKRICSLKVNKKYLSALS